MVIDSSVLLAIIFNEDHATWAAQELNNSPSALLMSTVNLAEVLIRVQDRQPKEYQSIRDRLFRSGIEFIPPDLEQSEIAAQTRLRFPLNLGDCFAYALAKCKESVIVTLDSDFVGIDQRIVMPK